MATTKTKNLKVHQKYIQREIWHKYITKYMLTKENTWKIFVRQRRNTSLNKWTLIFEQKQ